MRWISGPYEDVLAAQEGLCSTELDGRYIQTGPEAQPASCTTGTGDKVRQGHAADHSPHSSAAVMEE